jgi:hypothetical protein
MKVIVAEKIRVAEHIASALAHMNSKEEFTIICTYGITRFKRDYPKNIRWKDYPVLLNPKHITASESISDSDSSRFSWMLKFNGNCEVTQPFTDKKHLMAEECRDILQGASKIIFACDPDARGVGSFSQFINEFVPEKKDESFDAFVLYSYDVDHMAKMISNPKSTSDVWFQELLNAYSVKTYFDFNFDINSMGIFSKALANNVVHIKNPFISKFQIQLLYWFRKSGTQKVLSIIKEMEKNWKGTGKYDRHSFHNTDFLLGSASSRHRIIDELLKKGLIVKDTPPDASQYGNYNLEISASGLKFLNELHKDCEDLDLPYRIFTWMAEPFATAKPKIDAYINRYFSKQKRLMGTVTA